MIDEVVSVVLHNNVPDAAVDKVEVPLQLFTTLTEGISGTALTVAVTTLLVADTQPVVVFLASA